MIVKLLTEQHLEFRSLKGGYRGSSESTYVKIPHCWKSRATAQHIFVSSPVHCRRLALHRKADVYRSNVCVIYTIRFLVLFENAL